MEITEKLKALIGNTTASLGKQKSNKQFISGGVATQIEEKKTAIRAQHVAIKKH